MKRFTRIFLAVAFFMFPGFSFGNTPSVETHMNSVVAGRYICVDNGMDSVIDIFSNMKPGKRYLVSKGGSIRMVKLTEDDLQKINELKNFEIPVGMSVGDAYHKIYNSLKMLEELAQKLPFDGGNLILAVDDDTQGFLSALEKLIKLEGKVAVRYGTLYLAINAPIGYEERELEEILADEWKELSEEYELPKTKTEFIKTAQKLKCVFFTLAGTLHN